MTLRHAESDQLLDLLADRATRGLDAEHVDDLDRLIREADEFDIDSVDRAAAALDLVFLDPAEIEPMPAELRSRIEDRLTSLASEERPEGDGRIAGRIGPLGAFGWLAAAACLALAGVLWMSPARQGTAPSLAEVASAPDAIRASWSPGPDETGANASGEVIWSDSRQAGYMVFRGLPRLDPEEYVYQLWIFDPDKDEHPVDGGVFNIAPGATEARIPINAKLPVDDPTMFAVTIEQPGGVVVSKQERVPVLAKIDRG